jgi:hypothetical protein
VWALALFEEKTPQKAFIGVSGPNGFRSCPEICTAIGKPKFCGNGGIITGCFFNELEL